MTQELVIPTARVFEPLMQPGIRYRACWGGRGSGKSWFFAEALVEQCLKMEWQPLGIV